MRLLIKQRVFSWSDTYDVYDEEGNVRYFVRAEVFALGHQIHVYDAAHVEVGNEPSEKLLTGIGFEKEGLCREYLMLHGRWMDHYLFSLLKHDFYRRSIGQNQ